MIRYQRLSNRPFPRDVTSQIKKTADRCYRHRIFTYYVILLLKKFKITTYIHMSTGLTGCFRSTVIFIPVSCHRDVSGNELISDKLDFNGKKRFQCQKRR